MTVNDVVMHDGGNYNITIIKQDNQAVASVIRIVPNPLVTTSIIKIQSSQINGSDELQLNIFDAKGRKIKKLLFTGQQIELKRESLIAGVYYLEISKGSKTITTGKLFVK